MIYERGHSVPIEFHFVALQLLKCPGLVGSPIFLSLDFRYPLERKTDGLVQANSDVHEYTGKMHIQIKGVLSMCLSSASDR